MPLINKERWKQIISEAKRNNIPITKKRGIIREYLQSQILHLFYSLKQSRYFIFTGGTSLRLLYNNQRLSEDLDFDVTNKTIDIKQLIIKIKAMQVGESRDIEVKFKKRKDGAIVYFKYKGILYQLGISKIKGEKLVIKFDFTYPQNKVNHVTKILSKFGYLQSVLTYDLSTLLSFKTRALFTRESERARDLYDIAKLLSFNVAPNFNIKFFKQKDIKTMPEYAKLIQSWYKKHAKLLPALKKQLLPFLINEEEIKYIDILPNMVSA